MHISLPSLHCISGSATVSLILPAGRREGEGGRGRGRWTTSGALAGGASVLCGPVRLKPLVDVTGCAVQVKRREGLEVKVQPERVGL